MLILAIDTSWKHGSVALARGDGTQFEVIEIVALTGGAFSAELVPGIAGLLERAKLRKEAIDAFACVSGPGSFTGLRVGLAAIKGLVEVLHKPIAAVSALGALATVSGVSGRVFAALDAQRGEVFLGEYKVDSEALLASSLGLESLVSYEAFLAGLPGGATVVTPDASIAELVGARAEVRKIERPRADIIARIGVQKVLAGQTVAAGDLDANYVRRSAAEIFSQVAAEAQRHRGN